MRITKMWKTSESKTGGCPALYATDRNGYVVQGVKLDPEDRAQLEELADNEDAVFVPADVLDRPRPVRDAMTTDWYSVITGFERSLRRLEQLPSYRQDIDTESWRRWTAGEPACIPGADDHDWVAMVQSKTAAGATIERVRVIDDPMTPYQTWLIPASAEIVAAGESHRYVTRRVADQLLDVRRSDGDWWIVDDHTVVYLDGNGWGKVGTVAAEVNFALNVWKRAWGRVPAVA